MEESYPKGSKTLWEKEKLLVTSNFSFSHSVFKRLVSQGHQNGSLYGNGLTLPNDKILDMTKLKAYADDKFSFTSIMFSLLDRVENTVGKGENAGYQHFVLFQ